jgi:hypothetical protein
MANAAHPLARAPHSPFFLGARAAPAYRPHCNRRGNVIRLKRETSVFFPPTRGARTLSCPRVPRPCRKGRFRRARIPPSKRSLTYLAVLIVLLGACWPPTLSSYAGAQRRLQKEAEKHPKCTAGRSKPSARRLGRCITCFCKTTTTATAQERERTTVFYALQDIPTTWRRHPERRASLLFGGGYGVRQCVTRGFLRQLWITALRCGNTQ